MLNMWWTVAAAALVAGVISVCLLPRLRQSWRQSRLAQARRDFRLQRERLEANFIQLAARTGKPRGLAWADCEFDDDVAMARDRHTGELRALVGVTVRFEAIEGGDMEDVEAVGRLRAATAVFRAERNRWVTDGRAIFNLNPSEAIRHFQSELEMVD